MTRDEAIALLGITVPSTPNALKSAYRRRAFEEHPDRSKHPKAAERFRAVQQAYAALENDAEIVVGAPAEAKLDDGTPLSDLGQGLGPTINGRPCTACHGAGYRVVHRRKPCPDCRTIGIVWERRAFRCRRCSGSGRFMRNGKDAGVCFACSGVGWHPQLHSDQRCQTCHDTRWVDDETTAGYTRCDGCEGTGEIRVLNPVLPKGLFVGRGGS